jgi:predicted DNA-binding transcriptional regulator AlpA
MKSAKQAETKSKSRRPEYQPTDPLLTAREAAKERGQAVSTFWRDTRRGGLVPTPYYIGPKSPRWRLSEIRASIEATRKASGKHKIVTAK